MGCPASAWRAVARAQRTSTVSRSNASVVSPSIFASEGPSAIRPKQPSGCCWSSRYTRASSSQGPSSLKLAPARTRAAATGKSPVPAYESARPPKILLQAALPLRPRIASGAETLAICASRKTSSRGKTTKSSGFGNLTSSALPPSGGARPVEIRSQSRMPNFRNATASGLGVAAEPSHRWARRLALRILPTRGSSTGASPRNAAVSVISTPSPRCRLNVRAQYSTPTRVV